MYSLHALLIPTDTHTSLHFVLVTILIRSDCEDVNCPSKHRIVYGFWREKCSSHDAGVKDLYEEKTVRERSHRA